MLYPIGASSEAFLSLSTLPPLSTLSLESILASLNPLTFCLKYLPHSLRAKLIQTSIGRHALWTMAHAAVQRKTKDYWGFIEVARLVMFFVWWPGESQPTPQPRLYPSGEPGSRQGMKYTADDLLKALAVLMGHMFKLRKKVMRKGKGQTVGSKKTN